MLRRKMIKNGSATNGVSMHEGQLYRLRNMNGGSGGIMLTENNPNYEFGGETKENWRGQLGD